MTNKRKWTAMVLGVCILLFLLTACAPAGTINGSSSVPETVSSAPATSSDASSISAPSSETTSEAPPSVSSASSENSPVRTGYWFEDVSYYHTEEYADRKNEISQWSHIGIGWRNYQFRKLYYNGELLTLLPFSHYSAKACMTVARGKLLYSSCAGPELFLQEAPDKMPEVVCELPVYEQIMEIGYYPSYGPDDPNVFILTRRSQVYHFNLDTKELVHLAELPTSAEDIIFWRVWMGSKTKKIHIWAATEETYLLMEELEGQRGETVPETEKNEKHQEIFFSYDIYMYDFDTNEKIPYTEEEYYAEFGQLTE